MLPESCKELTMLRTAFLTTLFLVALLVSCKQNHDIMCTMEFRTVSITVNRDSLHHFHTIRVATGDTIRLEQETGFGSRVYPVLNDNFQSQLSGRSETFRFQGFVNNTMIVDEPFVIEADQCHINYVSGNTVVN